MAIVFVCPVAGINRVVNEIRQHILHAEQEYEYCCIDEVLETHGLGVS